MLYAATHAMYGRFTYTTSSVDSQHSVGRRVGTHHTARYVRSADVKIFTDAEKYPVDDSIGEELCCGFIILTIGGRLHLVLDGVGGRVGAFTSIVIAAFRGNLLPAKIGR